MMTRWIGVAAVALVVAAGPAWAGGDMPRESATKGTAEQKRAAVLTASAWAALGKGDAAKAIHDAEAVVLLLPRDAGARALLGRAYLAAGRFTSAETAFTDALTLDSSLSRVAVNRALAQIALGKGAAARNSLDIAEGGAPDADIGLAQALLGDSEGARRRLDAAARAASADARTRQNLGLVYALEGRWVDAVAVAEQDVPPDMMPQRLRRWAMIAQLKADPAMQIGAILGVLPAADSGQPAALALVLPAPGPVAPVALAEAMSAPVPATVPADAVVTRSLPAASAPVTPIVHTENGSVMTRISHNPPPLEMLVAAPSLVSPIATPAPQPVPASASENPVLPAAAGAKIMAWAGPPRMRMASASPSPSRPAEQKPTGKNAMNAAAIVSVAAVKPIAPKPILLASQVSLNPAFGRHPGNWAVQLGAFSSAQRTQIAWSRLTGKASFMSGYTPTGSGRRWGKAMLYRLSVSGLPTRQEAVKLCIRIRASGGSCFVRSARGERPMQWAARPYADQPV